MSAKTRQSFFSFLLSGISQNRITVVNAAVSVILIGTVIAVLLNRASDLQTRTAEQSVVNLAGITANEVQASYLSYLNIVRVTSQIVKNYNDIEVDQRRIFINNLMIELLGSNPSLMNVYTLWRPNALDERDAVYAGTPGYDETGQFISGFTRELGRLESRSFLEYKYTLDFNYQSADAYVGEPFPWIGPYGGSWVIEVQVPIFGSDGSVPGVLGITINLEMLQFLVEERRPYNGRTMVCTNRGTLLAHSLRELRGVSFMAAGLSVDDKEPLLANAIRTSVFFDIQASMINVLPTVRRFGDVLMVSYPLRTIDPSTAAYQAGDPGFPRWAVVTAVPIHEIMAPINELLRFCVFFIIGAAVVTVLVFFATSKSLTQRAHLLQRDLERASTMQDNLKYGLFLFDSKCIIQDAYSKALEKILSVPDLSGKNFLDLLSDSLKAQERSGMADYFDMILKKSFDKELLDSINPIVEFEYVSPDGSEKKSLRTSFTLAERGSGADFIMGTLEDITAEKELEKQLKEAENIRENEMKALFQVIQLDPRVLGNFVSDAEFEFQRINELLKSKKSLKKELLVELFQAVHAVKSDALILNLESFSGRLHKLEATVKELQERPDNTIPFDDSLGLIIEISDALKEIDQLKASVSRIENFRNVSIVNQNQEKYVLVETLSRVCEKTQASLAKKVQFLAEEIDDTVLDYGPRRIMKEVLTQLVRNAVYHGIEFPEERESLGKEPVGLVRLSMWYRNNQIVIKLSDDGRGVNFDLVRQKAETQKLFNNPMEANDRNFLIKTIFSPGFSTHEEADFYAGRGIGLSLVKDRVKELRGNISVATASGKGTSFTITIPMEIPAAAKVS